MCVYWNDGTTKPVVTSTIGMNMRAISQEFSDWMSHLRGENIVVHYYSAKYTDLPFCFCVVGVVLSVGVVYVTVFVEQY